MCDGCEVSPITQAITTASWSLPCRNAAPPPRTCPRPPRLPRPPHPRPSWRAAAASALDLPRSNLPRSGRPVVAPAVPAVPVPVPVPMSLSVVPSQRYAAVRQAFDEFDADGSGVISRRDMRLAMTALYGRSGTLRSAKHFFAGPDEDGSGGVDIAEFRQAVVRVMCADIASRLMQASPADEETILGSLMDDTEAVVAAEHALLYKYQLGELKLAASHTQEARVEARPKLQVGETIDSETYEKWLRTGGAAILDASRTDVRHIGGQVASVLVVPISTPGRYNGNRVIGLLEFVNVAGAFDEMEKNVAVRLAEHLSHVFVVASLWGASSTKLRGIQQLDRLVKLTLAPEEDGYDRIGDALVDTCDSLHAKNPGCHIFVLFLANLVDGERWDDRSKMNDACVAAALAPLENVMVVEVSIREEDWRAERQAFPLSHHSRWRLMHLPSLVHYRGQGERLPALYLRKPNVPELEEFIRRTLAGDENVNTALSSPQPIRLAQGASRAVQRTALLAQLETQRASAKQLSECQARFDESISTLEKLLGNLRPDTLGQRAEAERRASGGAMGENGEAMPEKMARRVAKVVVAEAIHVGVRAALAATAADMHIESAQGGSPAKLEPNVSFAPTSGGLSRWSGEPADELGYARPVSVSTRRGSTRRGSTRRGSTRRGSTIDVLCNIAGTAMASLEEPTPRHGRGRPSVMSPDGAAILSLVNEDDF
eukprot:Transcript_21429.p1 GENE.Transcript_21429~~Transcript_21429.p1  ORF type:complete len:714 (+),score=46.70 Transcript_21429:699-2840(+)